MKVAASKEWPPRSSKKSCDKSISGLLKIVAKPFCSFTATVSVIKIMFSTVSFT